VVIRCLREQWQHPSKVQIFAAARVNCAENIGASGSGRLLDPICNNGHCTEMGSAAATKTNHLLREATRLNGARRVYPVNVCD